MPGNALSEAAVTGGPGVSSVALTAPGRVLTFISIMGRYIATVIRTGNSIALRVPKQYVLDAKLEPGEKVSLALPTKQKPQDHAKIARLIAGLQELRAYSAIPDPAVEELFEECEQLDLDEPVIQRAIILRQQLRMTLGDAIIAATALVYDYELWTANKETFSQVDGLRLGNPLDP